MIAFRYGHKENAGAGDSDMVTRRTLGREMIPMVSQTLSVSFHYFHFLNPTASFHWSS